VNPTSTSRGNTGISSKDRKHTNKHSSSPDDTSPEVNTERCPLCGGYGFVYPISESGEVDYSQVVPCSCQHELLQIRKLERLQKYSNIGSLSELTFEKLLNTKIKGERLDHDLFIAACHIARDYAERPEGWLLLIGPGNSGKTLIACAIVNHCLASERAAFYIGSSDLMDHLRAAFAPESSIRYDDLFEQVKNTPLLVLDDLRSETETAWAKEKFEQLLNYRFNLRLATVITTDSAPGKFDEHIRNRFEDRSFCKICTIGEKSPLQRLGNLPPGLLQNMKFSNFDHKRLELPSDQRQNLQQAYLLAKDFADNPDGWLILQGINGCGKTHLAASIVNERMSRGLSSFFIFVPDLLDQLRSSFSHYNRIPYEDFFSTVKDTELLILDDFGQQSSTPWAQEKLYQLINYRYNTRLPMVVTTCLSLEEIESRISSRMVDPRLSLVFNIIAPDYRGNIGKS